MKNGNSQLSMDLISDPKDMLTIPYISNGWKGKKRNKNDLYSIGDLFKRLVKK